jgi:hypothetical protein
MKHAVYILITVIFVTSGYRACNLVSEHLNDRIKIRTEGVLSDIADKVESIPLETPDSGRVTRIRRVLKDGDNIFLISDNRLLRYDISGKFVNHVARDIAENSEYIERYALNVAQRQVIVIDGRRNIITYSYSGELISKTALHHRWKRISALEFYSGYLWVTAETYVKTNDSDNSFRIVNNLYQIDRLMNIISETPLKTADVSKPQMLNIPFITEILAGEDGLYAYSLPYGMDCLLEDTLYILQQKKLPSLHVGETFGNKCIYSVRRGHRFFISGNKFTFCYDDKNHTAYKLNEGFKDDFFNTGNVSNLHPVDIYGNTYCYFCESSTGGSANLYIFTLKA